MAKVDATPRVNSVYVYGNRVDRRGRFPIKKGNQENLCAAVDNIVGNLSSKQLCKAVCEATETQSRPGPARGGRERAMQT